MVNEDILGGLKSALSRGYSLEKAMLSFFNAGYKRDEIEEAARTLQIESASSPHEMQPQPIWTNKQGQKQLSTSNTANKISPSVSAPKVLETHEAYIPAQIQKQIPEIAQTGVSAYRNQGSKTSAITIILIILLVLLLGILGIMYLFKDQIIQFFNGLF